MQDAGRGGMPDFPEVTRYDDLPAALNNVYELVFQYGSGCDHARLNTKLKSIHPEEMREKVLDQGEQLKTPLDITCREEATHLGQEQ